jgi:hypothetical protein
MTREINETKGLCQYQTVYIQQKNIKYSVNICIYIYIYQIKVKTLKYDAMCNTVDRHARIWI